jgi:predicted DNA-binding transcriptional regulator YafY
LPYQRSLEIENRLNAVLRLIRAGSYSTPMLAEKLGVSIPTISRTVAALRERGHDIQAEQTNKGWRYGLKGGTSPTSQARLPKSTASVGTGSGSHDN